MDVRDPALLLGKRILVADQPLICMELCSLLEEAGAEVVGPTWSVEKALELANRQALSCGVLGASLREGPVLPVATALRQSGTGIVFLTTHPTGGMLKQDWPEAQFVAKPATQDAILKAVAIASTQPCGLSGASLGWALLRFPVLPGLAIRALGASIS